MEDRIRRYDIRNLDYIQLPNKNKNALAYLNEDKDYYVDITSNSVTSDFNGRVYRSKNTPCIDKFVNMLAKEELEVLLLDQQGKFEHIITLGKCMTLFDTYNRVKRLDSDRAKLIDNVANQVVDICVSVLKVPTANLEQFKYLLKNYVRVDIILQGTGSQRAIIVKDGECIDYKISRIFKLLGVNVDLKLIPNFKIEYNLTGIYLNNSENIIKKDNSEKKLVKALN